MPASSRLRSAAAAAAVAALLVGAAAPAAARVTARPAAPAAPVATVTTATTATTVAATLPARAPRPRAVVASSLVCELVGGLRLCTHGDDAHLDGATTAPGSSSSSSSSTASTKIGCYSSGPRVQAVYARPAGTKDRYNAMLPSFRGWAGAVEKSVDDSARKTRGARHVRFVSVPAGDSCTLSVLRVALPQDAFSSFSAMVKALQELGLDKAGVKYLVWADASQYCGIASTYQDDSAGQDNLNNGRFPSYARVDRSCWGKAEAHELMHMLGAVQRSAPHATAGMHCRDGSDVMCYDDGTRGSKQTAVCASSHARLLDCRGDDYFSTSPPAGSYLATHWNTASSAFLARGWTDPAPPPPAKPAEPAPTTASPSPTSSPTPTAEPEPENDPETGGSTPMVPLVLPTVRR